MGEKDHELCAMFTDFGLTASSGYALKLKDVFTGEEVGTYKEYFRAPVPAHDCRVYRAQMVAYDLRQMRQVH